MLKLIVDFNAVRDGLVRGLIEDASGDGEITKGQRVLLDDDEGTQAAGIISRVENGLVFAGVLDWGFRPQKMTVMESIAPKRYRPRRGQPSVGSLPRVKGAERQLEPA